MMVADTNVWARAYLNDDEAQAQKARKALADGRAKEGVFVPLIVLAELSWVLRSRWDRPRILNTLESLLQTRGVHVEASALVREALAATREGGTGGFADHLVAHVGFANGAHKFANASRVRRLT